MTDKRQVVAKTAECGFGKELARIEPSIGTSGPLWLRRLQKTAYERFRALGFPGTREEEWRQTNTAPIAKTAFRRAEGPASLTRADLARFSFADSGVPRLVFVDGRHAPELSSTDGLAAGIEAGSLADAWRDRPQVIEPHLSRLAQWEKRSFVALNTALFLDGAFVSVPEGSLDDNRLEILHVVSPSADPLLACPRLLVVVGERARLSLAETYVTPDDSACFTNAVTELVVGDNADVRHVRVQLDGRRAYHVSSLDTRQGPNSRFLSVNVSLGAALTRNDVGAVLDGEGAECTLDGLYVADREQHVDNHTTIDHARPHCASHELYKGVLADSARAVFNGRIIVRPGAQKTDAKQSNRNLLLSDDAVVHTRPQLEIYANDVKCTHGATIGHLDEEALFYLQSRGIGRRDARGLLIGAFTGRVLQEIAIPRLREAVEAHVTARLERGAADRERA